ncbi:MAG: alanine--tRNA ligase, partial [Nanoarchaeota archaeon]
MQPLTPFLLGQKHPLGNRVCSVQKCIRTGDIEEVGDEVHHTFFEMLGNWSFGDYFKEEAIIYSFEFLTKFLGIPKEKLAVSCFSGDDSIERDEVSFEIWGSLGIQRERIKFLPRENNWWGPAGETGPCGPDTEIFYWTKKGKAPKVFDPIDKNWVEIWNDVFMQYEKTKDQRYLMLKQKNVDTGMGVERTLAALNGLQDNYRSSIFLPVIKEIEKLSRKKYEGNEKGMRIIADHLRASAFILGDDHSIKPSNIGRGYVLRRLIRRAVKYGLALGIKDNFCKVVGKVIIEQYNDYDELKRNKKIIFEELEKEEKRFKETLEKGIKKFEEICKLASNKISGENAFLLFQSYGFPVEMTLELAEEKGKGVDLESYKLEFERHQKLSRTSSAGMFKSGLADSGEKTTRLHTATHLLNEVLRKVLEDKIRQRGSNITSERLRFDFNFSRKLTDEEIKDIEKIVNEKINSELKVIREEMALKEAVSSGAQSEFGAKYPEKVSVYTILDKKEKKGWFSKEVCTGPHVGNTKEIGKFKIIKEEGVAAGIRRIKAVVLD